MRTLLRFIQKYSNFLLFLLLEIVAFILIAQDQSYQRSRIVGINRQISGFFYSKTDGAREYLSLKKINENLFLENSKLHNQLNQMKEGLDSSIVRSISNESFQYQYMPARVVHNTVYKQYNYLTLDKGREQGIFKDMGVTSENGLVGIVLESSKNFSTVIPVINLDFRLSVKLQSNDYAGILQWDGSSPDHATLNEIPFHVEVTDGDTLVSSGFSSIFPEGIMVGTIESHSLEKGNFYEIKVKLSTDFQGLFQVNIIRNFRQKEQRELEASR